MRRSHLSRADLLDLIERLEQLCESQQRELDSITDDHVAYTAERAFAAGETINVRVPRRYKVR